MDKQMIRELTHLFPRHQAVRVPRIVKLPLFGYKWLPVWIDFEWEFITPKGHRLTLEGMAHKANLKVEKLKKKMRNYELKD